MTWTEWFIVYAVVHCLHAIGTWKLYVRAGRNAWEAFVPIYNVVVLMKIINRPWWWTILLFLPIVNQIMIPVVLVEIARSFGKNTLKDTVLAVLSFGFYNGYLNYVAQNLQYIQNRDLKPKSASGDWTSAILFAVVAATIVHTYFIQPFVIPSSSLEKTLLVGDFLFVSKFHYGARTPMTTVATPMLHDTIPLVKVKSYSSWPELPYFRLPGFQDIKRNDIVVFNWPVDTMVDMFYTDKHYYKPIDKKTNYVKRCVGLPGDSLSVKDGYVYINGKKNDLPDRSKLQFSYAVYTKNGGFNKQYLSERYDISDKYFSWNNNPNLYIFMSISDEALAKFKNHPNVLKIEPIKQTEGEWVKDTYPQKPNYPWNNDFFGPIYIPEKGKTIPLNTEVLPLYKRVISVYENNKLEVKNGQIYINGALATSYTFKQNYYWMMGDNRHNSQDARVWGFVPFDHIVGKPVFIWMSWGNGKPRWERFFTTVGGSGKPRSYLVPFLVLLAAGYGFNAYRKRKKATK